MDNKEMKNIRGNILREAHTTSYYVHPGATKMYRYLKMHYWWQNMKDFQGQWSKVLPLVEFAYNNSYQAIIGMDPYEALYDRKCRSPVYWDEVGERKLLSPNMIAPMKLVMQFGKNGKVSPKYIGPFTITERIGNVAYKLDLPTSMSQVHLVFHVSMLRKYIGNLFHVLKNEPMEIKLVLTYEEKPVEILQREIKQLRSKKIPLVK
ncbi:uncharacterized protein LOC111375744, partial [Olea europaea var. sylvestris]|uniref:uncharacterized protein LOC111375744 n=1 Tax=Olea europaea var. sylvestris TaxID=158386 RepID=UPI000C1D47D7